MENVEDFFVKFLAAILPGNCRTKICERIRQNFAAFFASLLQLYLDGTSLWRITGIKTSQQLQRLPTPKQGRKTTKKEKLKLQRLGDHMMCLTFEKRFWCEKNIKTKMGVAINHCKVFKWCFIYSFLRQAQMSINLLSTKFCYRHIRKYYLSNSKTFQDGNGNGKLIQMTF